ncbi:hypothetical protein [Agrococcus pavilionensis]|uniref:hypothetical protein n=1 Tax=Agrococcus pavilionensis TaxID=1346502 RepID=UPI00190F96A7|nr:hypothetical protein [Agrococcus pavilionensis]
MPIEPVVRHTDEEGVLAPVSLVASDATGVTVPWNVTVARHTSAERRFSMLVVAGAQHDLADVIELPPVDMPVDEWAALVARIEEALAGGGGGGADGASAYELAVGAGFVGTLEQWLDSLVGERGAPGDPGEDGAPGASAYDVAVSNGFVGSEAAWLASLKGDPGGDGAPGDAGNDGASAYELAVANGFVGTEVEWLASLKGDPAATQILVLDAGEPVPEGTSPGTVIFYRES